LGELGRLLYREQAMGILQETRDEFHRSQVLNFRHRQYVRIDDSEFSARCRRMASTAWFNAVGVSLILASTVVASLAAEYSDQGEEPAALRALDLVVVCAFCAECLFVMAGYGKRAKAWKLYFTGLRVGKWESQAKWNTFDFFVSFGSLAMLGFSNRGSNISVLRLLRIVRILKQLLAHAAGFIVIMEGPFLAAPAALAVSRQHQGLAQCCPLLPTSRARLLNTGRPTHRPTHHLLSRPGLKKGLDSIFYICCLLLFVLFLFGAIGVSLFGENDPNAFGGLATAMLTL